jgi:hypothetical protein
MQIIAFARSDEHHSVGAAAGEGLLASQEQRRQYRALFEMIDGEWQIDPLTAPVFLKALVAAKGADERWRHGEP